MGDPMRRETATASVAAEAIEVKRKEFLELTRRDDAKLDPLQKDVSRRVVDNARMQVRPEAGSLMNFLMDEGLGEATNVLVIDESLCVGCDNCEKACAETHGGVSRLDREAGATYANVHIPICLSSLRAAALHEGLPAERDPPLGERRGLHQRLLHRLRQLPGELSLRRDPHGVRRAEETRPVVVAAVRARQRSGRSPGLRADVGSEGEGQEGGEVRCLRRRRRWARLRARVSHGRCDPHRPRSVHRPARGAQAVIHRGLLRYRRQPLLVVVARVCCALSIVLYSTQGDVQPPNGGTWQGYVLGHDRRAADRLAGAARYPQAHVTRSTLGTVQGWVSAHVYLGTALLIVATLH